MESLLGGRVTLYCGDSRDVLKTLADNSVDAMPCDPPYALVSIQDRFGEEDAAPARGDVYARSSAGFMGKKWDTGEAAFDPDFWREAYRVLKPGAFVAAFAGTRTYHRLACAIEDAGFIIRDQAKWMHEADAERHAFLASLNDEQRAQFLKLFGEVDELGQISWTYGSGFPKSHNVSKFIDKALGATREVISTRAAAVRFDPDGQGGGGWSAGAINETAPATPEAMAWQGWGTALKPAWEPICLARKPLIGTIAQNVLAHGTGGLNIDGCRIDGEDAVARTYTAKRTAPGATQNATGERKQADVLYEGQTKDGRWPANIIHDGSAEVLAAFPAAPGQKAYLGPENGPKDSVNTFNSYGPRPPQEPRGDSGSAARFFYTAKADGDDRLGSKHPTVKPVDLMQWLCRLITPPGGTVLDPFAGTGSTGEAAFREGFAAVLIEREPEYQADIRRRMELALRGTAARKRAYKSAKKPEPPKVGGMFGDE